MTAKIDRYTPPSAGVGSSGQPDGKRNDINGYFSESGYAENKATLIVVGSVKSGECNSKIFGQYKLSDIKDKNAHKSFLELERKVHDKSQTGPIDLKQFSAYLKAAVTCFRMDSADNIPQRIFASQNPPLINIFTCNILLAGYCSCGNLKNSSKLFEQMKSGHHLNLSPDATTYNTLFEGYIKANKPKDAMELYQSFKQDHPEMLDIRTYTAAIKLMVKFGQLNNARELFNTLLDNKNVDLQPNRFTYNALLEGYINPRDLQSTRHIENLILQMKVKFIKPDNITLNLLVIYYFKQGKADRAIEHFETLGVVPNQVNYFTLINNLVKVNKLDQACEYLIQALEHQIRFDHILYRVLLNKLRKQGNYAQVLQIFNAMNASDAEIRISSYASAINACINLDKADEAVNIMQLVVDSPGINKLPEYALYFLLKCLLFCKLDQVVKEFMANAIEVNKDKFSNNPQLTGLLEQIEKKLNQTSQIQR